MSAASPTATEAAAGRVAAAAATAASAATELAETRALLASLNLSRHEKFAKKLSKHRLLSGQVSASELRGLGFKPVEIERLLGWALSQSENCSPMCSPLLRPIS